LQQLDSMDKQIKICKGKISWIDYHQALEVVEKVQKEVELKTQLDENSGGVKQYPHIDYIIINI